MCLAVAQAILACLKCGWDSEKGTNLLRPSLCNDQQEGDVSFFFAVVVVGVDIVRVIFTVIVFCPSLSVLYPRLFFPPLFLPLFRALIVVAWRFLALLKLRQRSCFACYGDASPSAVCVHVRAWYFLCSPLCIFFVVARLCRVTCFPFVR